MPSDSAASRDIPFLVIERVLPLLKSPPAGLLPVGIAVDFAESDPARPAVRLLDASQQQIAEKATLLIGPWSQLEDKHPAATVDAICSAFPGIRTVHVGQAGIEHVAAAPCFKRGVKLTNARGTTSIPIAEFVMMVGSSRFGLISSIDRVDARQPFLHLLLC